MLIRILYKLSDSLSRKIINKFNKRKEHGVIRK